MAKTNDKLAILFPEKEITLAGERFILRPFSFGETPAVIAAATEMIGDIARLNLSADGGLALTEENAPALALLLEKHFDKISYLISLCSGMSKEKVDALPYDIGLGLAMQVLELNKDFFITRVRPLLMAATAPNKKQVPGAK